MVCKTVSYHRPLGLDHVVSVDGDGPSSRAWLCGYMYKDSVAAGQSAHRLTDLLTRLPGTGETTRDTGDAQQGSCLVGETSRDVRDGGRLASAG
jgi:hypothetical protein